MDEEKITQIFNLEFPPYIEELKIGDYIFKRVKNYKEAFDGMMCLVNSSGSEFNTQIKVGSHQITAIVEIPQKEKGCILPFGNTKLTQLDDVLFLLTIFTDRNVFKKDWEDSDNIAIISDHRIHQYGGQLACSIKYDSRWKHVDTGELKTETEMKGIPVFDYHQINIGFENTINKVLDLISSKKWQNEYEGGYFLFLFKSAMQRQIIETSFISCWTIWEHIFAIKNRKWLDNKAIEQMSGDKKIAFILNEYFLKNIDETARKNIQKINKTRNRLIHFGKKTEQIDYDEMVMFIRLTEQLIAIIFELSPSNIFNSFEALDKFLAGKKKS
ncbi:MAG: hypothetical protein Q8P68_03825 [Candidatus Peregrinibacteria bacterium]|nr:hypothetical protein [Candidatus Peregrinibacteria bacterium]